MSLGQALRRAVARLNRRAERVAAAGSVVQGGASAVPPVNAAGVRVAFDEVDSAERDRASAAPDEAAPQG